MSEALVTLAEFKAHLRVEHDEEDAYLLSLLRMAQAVCEDFCKRSFAVTEDEPVPEAVRLAILMRAAYTYTHREGDAPDGYAIMEKATKNLLWPHRAAEKLL